MQKGLLERLHDRYAHVVTGRGVVVVDLWPATDDNVAEFKSQPPAGVAPALLGDDRRHSAVARGEETGSRHSRT